MFIENIRSGYSNNYKMLIPAYETCVIIYLNNSHVTVKYKNNLHKLRLIESRMKPAGKLTKGLYG